MIRSDHRKNFIFEIFIQNIIFEIFIEEEVSNPSDRDLKNIKNSMSQNPENHETSEIEIYFFEMSNAYHSFFQAF